jgi:hypothetical protein
MHLLSLPESHDLFYIHLVSADGSLLVDIDGMLGFGLDGMIGML